MFREETNPFRVVLSFAVVSLALLPCLARAQSLQAVDAEAQPVAANVGRVLQALEVLGSPLPAETTAALKTAIDNRDAKKIQELLDPHVLIQVTLNPESRVKVARGPATATLTGRFRTFHHQGRQRQHREEGAPNHESPGGNLLCRRRREK